MFKIVLYVLILIPTLWMIMFLSKEIFVFLKMMVLTYKKKKRRKNQFIGIIFFIILNQQHLIVGGYSL